MDVKEHTHPDSNLYDKATAAKPETAFSANASIHHVRSSAGVPKVITPFALKNLPE